MPKTQTPPGSNPVKPAGSGSNAGTASSWNNYDALLNDLARDLPAHFAPGDLPLSAITLPGGLKISYGAIATGSTTIVHPGSGDWKPTGAATGQTQVSLAGSPTSVFVICGVTGGSIGSGSPWTCQGTDTSPVLFQSWSGSTLTSGVTIGFIAIHN